MNAKVVLKDGFVYLITDDKAVMAWGGSNDVFTIPTEVFGFVENFINLARTSLEPMMCEGQQPGTILYWEENIHDKLVGKLEKMSDYSSMDISNSLSAFGF